MKKIITKPYLEFYILEQLIKTFGFVWFYIIAIVDQQYILKMMHNFWYYTLPGSANQIACTAGV